MKESLLIVEDEFIVANDLTIILENAGYTVCAIADSVISAKRAVEKFRPAWVLLDIILQDGSMGTELAPYLQERGIGYIYISANTNQSILEIVKNTQPYGFLVKPFREKDLLIMLDIAHTRHESNLHFAVQRQHLLQRQIRSLKTEDITGYEKIQKLPAVFQSIIPFDQFYIDISRPGHQPLSCGYQRTGFDEYQQLSGEHMTGFQVITATEGFTVSENEGIVATLSTKQDLHLYCHSSQFVLQLIFTSKTNEAFDQTHITLLCKTGKAILDLISPLDPTPVIEEAKPLRPAVRISRPREDSRTTKFDGILGNSAALLHVLDNIELVAATPVSVLILGESGTGKEQVAHNIHRLSSRKHAPFIVVNCAAMPAELIESELFGHEKGAFTGAVEKRVGKLEMAQGGTVFLDEIGEMPLESQVKMLRVLQEKEFERIGSSRTIKIDVRFIAATNRNLEKEVAEGRFRLDLFYRLNVYPIEMPPLRSRLEDIPVLADYFIRRSAAAFGRSELPQLSSSALKQLSSYYWPGNIRQLEHLMERTLIKTRGLLIEQVELPEQAVSSAMAALGNSRSKTMEQIEAEHILAVLKSCNGKVTGVGGAAEVLGLPPSTLSSRMKKLGIRKELSHDR
jgi:DNA-binding NtrC family response regulator